MSTPEAAIQSKPVRYLRSPRVVNVRELDDDHARYLITDLEDKNEYVVTKQVLNREYEEI